MRSTVIARLLLAAGALAVAASLFALERDHDRCQDATRAAFLASYAHDPARLRRYGEGLVRECRGSEPLTRIAAGLRDRRPHVAARLARTAAGREPDSYVAWGVLAIAAPRPEATAARRRALALNPLAPVPAPPGP